MICPCYFCSQGKEHPDERHPNKYEISSRLLKAESLDPKDRVQRFACSNCGHVTEKT